MTIKPIPGYPISMNNWNGNMAWMVNDPAYLTDGHLLFKSSALSDHKRKILFGTGRNVGRPTLSESCVRRYVAEGTKRMRVEVAPEPELYRSTLYPDAPLSIVKITARKGKKSLTRYFNILLYNLAVGYLKPDSIKMEVRPSCGGSNILSFHRNDELVGALISLIPNIDVVAIQEKLSS